MSHNVFYTRNEPAACSKRLRSSLAQVGAGCSEESVHRSRPAQPFETRCPAMRLSIEHNTEAAVSTSLFSARMSADPALPDVAFLTTDTAAALQSFFRTVDRAVNDNPVATPRLLELTAKARAGGLTPQETQELETLKLQALRQGRAVGAVIGFFLKLKPYPMLEEIRQRGKLFQPIFGPVLIVDGATVRNVLERDQEFTVEPYGV